MTPRARLSWPPSSIRLRLLSGLAFLLVVGLAASSVIDAFLLDDFIKTRYTQTLHADADALRDIISRGPQTANADQIAAFLSPPLGIVAVDSADRVLLSTGSGRAAPDILARLTTAAPPGTTTSYESPSGRYNLSAVRIPSPGLIIHASDRPAPVRPSALIITIDTSVDASAVHTLIAQQAGLVGAALVLLLALALLVLRFGMRPLTRMAHAADAIAAGSLTERLPTRADRSETDQLANAVNRAFDAQARAEATVRSLAADTSHELRTPLAAISGWLDLYRQGAVTGPGLETALDNIENQVGRMRLLVEDLGLLARLDAGSPIAQDNVDLTELAASVVEDAQIINPERSISLIAPGPTPVTGDTDRLQQVLRNLVGNAVQHTPAPATVTVHCATTRKRVELQVIDNGPGISPHDLPRVFERFWRAEASRSRAHGGSGLGLAIVEAIVHAHDGQVIVESTVGSGTTITVHLPHASAADGSVSPLGGAGKGETMT